MEKNFSEQDSLRIINEMITTARGNLQIGAGKYFILWGYLVFLTSIAHILILYFWQEEALRSGGNIWLITLVIGIPATIIFAVKDSKKSLVSTYTDKVVSNTWIGCGVLVILIMLLLSGKLGWYIYPAITFVYSYALFISATAYKFKWMYISAAVCMLCAISYKFIPYESYVLIPLPMAVAMLCGNILPGHILNYLAKKQHV